MNIKSIVNTVPILMEASPSSKTKIISYAMVKKYKKGDYLFRTRDQVEYIFITVSGYAVLERINRHHDKRVIFLLGKNDILNEVVLERPNASINAYALTDLEVVKIPIKYFLEIMENDFEFTRSVIDSMAKKIRRMYHQVENTTKMMRLDRQVASRLWKMGRDFGIEREDYIELPFRMTITFLAEMVGSNRETVSRVIKDLTASGIVSIQYGTCKIYNIEALKQYTDHQKKYG